MKDNPFKLGNSAFNDIAEHLEAARSALDTFVDAARAAVDERSDGWQETERGAAVLNWIDQLQDLTEEISTFPDQLPRTPE